MLRGAGYTAEGDLHEGVAHLSPLQRTSGLPTVNTKVLRVAVRQSGEQCQCMACCRIVRAAGGVRSGAPSVPGPLNTLRDVADVDLGTLGVASHVNKLFSISTN